ncbi:ATP-binding protein [Streptomyces sp. NPDC088116]|uniref:ATP-binding protein n=1 Tax=Streptomyces sp. NPDC088116 TaxID=3365825 RepID=UPI003800AEA5
MKSEIPPVAVSTGPAAPAGLVAPPPRSPLYPPSRVKLSSSHRGARLARLLAGQQLEEWGIPRTGSVSAVVVAIVAELAANAVTHGRTPGRDFELRLTLTCAAVRVEVIDTRPDRFPRAPGVSAPPPPDSTHGRVCFLSPPTRTAGAGPFVTRGPRPSGPKWTRKQARMRAEAEAEGRSPPPVPEFP